MREERERERKRERERDGRRKPGISAKPSILVCRRKYEISIGKRDLFIIILS